MLDALGLTGPQIELYRAVLHRPTATPEELAAETGLDLSRIRSLLSDLERWGLVARHPSDQHSVVASPPALALQPLIVERERALARAQEALVELSEVYRVAARGRNAADVVDVVVGEDAVRQRVAQLQASAGDQVRAFVRSDVAVLSAEDNTEEDRALARGVRYRVIVESSALERPGFLDGARDSVSAGEQVRVLPALPTRLLIADERMALLPMHAREGDRGYGALLVHPSGLLDLLVSVFEVHWDTATDLFSPGPGTAEREVDDEVLRLLLLGLTDAAMAAQLRVSVRTVQRRIAQLMQRAGATSRVQLGAQAVRRGWV